MKNENQDRLSSWDEFISGTFLKAANVNSEDEAFVVKNVSEVERDEKPQVRLTLERNGTDWEFDLNKTNAVKSQESVDKPKDLVGKKIYFKKALVRNPSTNKEVESLRISKVE